MRDEQLHGSLKNQARMQVQGESVLASVGATSDPYSTFGILVATDHRLNFYGEIRNRKTKTSVPELMWSYAYKDIDDFRHSKFVGIVGPRRGHSEVLRPRWGAKGIAERDQGPGTAHAS